MVRWDVPGVYGWDGGDVFVLFIVTIACSRPCELVTSTSRCVMDFWSPIIIMITLSWMKLFSSVADDNKKHEEHITISFVKHLFVGKDF